MIAILTANQPTLLQSFERLSTVYIKQYGGGNLRMTSNREDLQNTIGAPTQDGIAQATADGFKQYFWEGDLWVISDQNGPIVLVVPTNQFYIDRGVPGSTPSKVTTRNARTGSTV